ncbi:uncharacterized protein LOC131688410 [Topomyia yanbarensis]|uniref:uncharacterized protein LOC131688410 n=1 Tax=Topomyia yanbarensis TaxID=2498891 RepID=UPI00273C4E40|nr:uncharacterized protein LOC131688410 [Topomyia yanbarensis]
MSQVDLLEEICHLRFTAERDLLNSWEAYRVSNITRQLASEADRTIYAEAIAFSDVGDGGSKTFFPKYLSTLVVERLAAAYKGGPMPKGVTCQQARDFGSMLNIELPIIDIVKLDNETFWKQVVKVKTKRLVDFLKLEQIPGVYWKPFGIELKVAEAIENEKPEYWFEGCLEDILIETASFIRKLELSQLLPLEKVEPAEGYEEYKVYNAPPELCSHGSLEILKHLVNLTSLSLVFGLDSILKGYERRFFQFSFEDMENLGKALPKLQLLQYFTMARSRMSPDKLKLLLGQLAQIKLKSLELSYCYLGEDIGILLGKYISRCPETLEAINLTGNFLNDKEIEDFSYGINVYQGFLDKLDISHNPIGEPGILVLGGAIKNTRHVRELNVTGCELGEQGAYRVVQLIGFHRPLKILHMNCTPLGKSGGKKLVEVLLENWQVEQVNCKSCQLRPRHEKRVKSILRRNHKFQLSQNQVGRRMIALATVPQDIADLSTFSISPYMVIAAARKLKSSFSPGPDEIPAAVYCRCAVALAQPLSRIYNQSFDQAKFPEVWKQPYMFPVFKAGDNINIKQYQGITNLSAGSKSGIPQGSNLGPLLISLFFNDVAVVLDSGYKLIFVDDLTLYLVIQSAEDCYQLQALLDRFVKWCGLN